LSLVLQEKATGGYTGADKVGSKPPGRGRGGLEHISREQTDTLLPPHLSMHPSLRADIDHQLLEALHVPPRAYAEPLRGGFMHIGCGFIRRGDGFIHGGDGFMHGGGGNNPWRGMRGMFITLTALSNRLVLTANHKVVVRVKRV
jgi:hypothetical protein